jgi:cell division protein FtsQ
MTATLGVDDDAPGSAPVRRRPSRRSLVLGAVVFVVLLFVAVWVLAFSSVFGVRHVAVRGERTLSQAQVVSAAAVANGTPLLRLDTGAVARRVGRLPEVAAVSVRTHFPSTVTITVTERVAVGVVKDGSRYQLLDRTGAAFRATSLRPRGLPLFVVPLGSQHRAVDHAVATVAAQLPASLRRKTHSIQALDPSAITLLMRNGQVVHWGSAAETARKAELLPALLRQRSQAIDLSDPTQPFTR